MITLRESALVAWVQTLVEKDEETTFLCLETGFDGRTTQAVREALGEKGDGVATLIAIDDPMPVARVREYVRKRNIRLLVTGPFALPAVGEKEQTVAAHQLRERLQFARNDKAADLEWISFLTARSLQ